MPLISTTLKKTGRRYAIISPLNVERSVNVVSVCVFVYGLQQIERTGGNTSDDALCLVGLCECCILCPTLTRLSKKIDEIQTQANRSERIKSIKILSTAKEFRHIILALATMTAKKKSKKSEELISAKEAAERLDLTEQQTRSLIRDGKLPATRIGRTWIIAVKDLPLAEKRPKPGRPVGAKSASKKKGTMTEDVEDD